MLKLDYTVRLERAVDSIGIKTQPDYLRAALCGRCVIH